MPIDFSDPCSKALRYAVGFAEQFGAVLSLVHVLELDPYVNRLLNQLPGSLERDMAKQAEETLAALAQAEIHELIPDPTSCPSWQTLPRDCRSGEEFEVRFDHHANPGADRFETCRDRKHGGTGCATRPLPCARSASEGARVHQLSYSL